MQIRHVLGYVSNYTKRLRRWLVILAQVRGNSFRDSLVLFSSALAAPITSLMDLGKWQDPVLLRDCNVYIRDIGVFELRAKTDDLWHVLPWRESSIFNALRSFLAEGDTFIDAGANIGIYSVLCSRIVGDRGRVLSVEMMPDTAKILSQHVERNSCRNVEIVQRALSDVSDVTLTAEVVPGKYGQASISRSPADSAEKIEVRTVTLDSIVAEIDTVKVMKIDLEGAELKAFHGGTEMLRKTLAVVFEDNGTDEGSSASLSDFLRGMGFEIEDLDGNNKLAVNLTAKNLSDSSSSTAL